MEESTSSAWRATQRLKRRDYRLRLRTADDSASPSGSWSAAPPPARDGAAGGGGRGRGEAAAEVVADEVLEVAAEVGGGAHALVVVVVLVHVVLSVAIDRWGALTLTRGEEIVGWEMANAEATGWGLGRGWGRGEEAAFASDWRLDCEPEPERRLQPASGTAGRGLDWVGRTRTEGRGRRGGDATHGGKERERG